MLVVRACRVRHKIMKAGGPDLEGCGLRSVSLRASALKYPQYVRVWSISDEKPGSATKGVYPFSRLQILAAHFHMCSFRMISISFLLSMTLRLPRQKGRLLRYERTIIPAINWPYRREIYMNDFRRKHMKVSAQFLLPRVPFVADPGVSSFVLHTLTSHYHQFYG